MKSFHLLAKLDSAKLTCQWFGASAIHLAGSADFKLRPGADATLAPDQFLIDLQPLLAELAYGITKAEETFQEADEFLVLRDLLETENFETLTASLFRFLYQQTQMGHTFEAVRKSDDGRVWIDPDKRLVRVWFATDRKPIADNDIVRRFSSAESYDHITYGVCNVFIPKSHQPGSTGTPWWRRWIRLEADDSLKLDATHALPRDVFWAGLASKLSTWWQAGERNVFVYIHGYNVSFDEAAVGAAQLGYDLKVPGEMAFYSWPSRGSKIEYAADEATITASVKHIAQFLHELSAQSGAERIHLFVHSMGNRGFLSALERLRAKNLPQLSLGQVFFCAPDEDVRTFTDKTTEFPHQSENRTLLVSPQDNAVFLSKELRQLDRVGYVPPVTVVEGIETIEVGGFGMFDMGHGYFASAKPVIEDIREAIETKKSAKERKIPAAFKDHFMIDVRDHEQSDGR